MKILISCNEFSRSNLNKQPWLYIFKIAKYLVSNGFDVVIVTNKKSNEDIIDGIRIIHSRKIFQIFSGETREFKHIISKEKPDKIIMLLGMTSFLRFTFSMPKPVVGIITSPVYTVRELLLNVGIKDSLIYWDTLAIHYVNALIPSCIVRRWVNNFNIFIVLSEWNKERIVEKGVLPEFIKIIPPSIDEEWFVPPDSYSGRCSNPIQEIVYFTSPLTLRGSSDLLDAFSIVLKTVDARLKFVFRIDSEHSIKEIDELKNMAKRKCIFDKIIFIEKNMRIEDLINEIHKSDIVCIPFKIVISDVPISLMESMAAGVPTISTSVASIPEILKESGVCVQPNDAKILADAIIDILINSEIRKSMITKGRDKMLNHLTWDDVGKTFISMIGEANCREN